MMKVNTDNLSGAALNWAFAKYMAELEGLSLGRVNDILIERVQASGRPDTRMQQRAALTPNYWIVVLKNGRLEPIKHYLSDAQCLLDIIKLYRVTIAPVGGQWSATVDDADGGPLTMTANDPETALLRCCLTRGIGWTAEVPEDLVEDGLVMRAPRLA